MSNLEIVYNTNQNEQNTLSISTSADDAGWVEYCQKYGKVFNTVGVDHELYDTWRLNLITELRQCLDDNNIKKLGFVHHMAHAMLTEEFIFPLFVSDTDSATDPRVTCGTTRLSASILNGVDTDQLKSVVYSTLQPPSNRFKNHKEIATTKDFNKQYCLNDIDYRITMSDANDNTGKNLQVDESILKYSVYDKKDQTLPYISQGNNVLQYWNRTLNEDTTKIVINVHCTEKVAKLIQPSLLFEPRILHEPESEWQWSYGRLLGAYRPIDALKPRGHTSFNIWIYNIENPLYLDLLFPWVDGTHTCCHTTNKKVIFFDTSRTTGIQIIGDWAS
jgi:hypothetical protein